MSAVDFLLRLQALGVGVRVEGDRLKVSGLQDALTPELREAIAAHKAALVAFLRDESAGREDAIPRLASRTALPLSFTQQRFWFFHNLVPDTSAYHVAFGLRLAGPLDRAALGRSLDEIVRRHEVLRMAFTAVDGQPVQSACPPAGVPLPVEDFTSVPEAERRVRFEARARAFASEPFDLTAGRPIRAALFAAGPDDHALVVAMHHIASDAWSVTTFIREIAALYEAFSTGAVSPLPELPVQYADFASWQRGAQATAAFAAQRAYWSRKLADPPSLQLPSDRPRVAFQSFHGGRAAISIPRRLTDALDALARQERSTLFMALLAAFYTLLHRYSGQTDLVVGTAIAGRSRPELEPIIGPFINTLALRTDLSGDPTFRTLLARTRETALEAYANQDLPFEQVVDELRLERELSRNPLFQVMLALQNVPPAPGTSGGLRLAGFDIDRSTTVSDLEIVLWPTGSGLDGYVRYSADLYDAETIDRMLAAFRRLLDGGVAAPDRRLSELPILNAADQAQLAEWNRTAVPYRGGEAVHASFTDQASRTPDAAAVVWGGECLRYRDLDGRANGLAHRLVSLGARPDDRVGILLDRSADFIVAALAIMKAGAAYLPIETSCPAERLAFTIADAGVRHVVVDPALVPRVRACGAQPIDPRAGVERAGPRVHVDAEHLAYVIYTSGSTGRPKGVALTHRGLQNLVAWHRRVYRVTSADRAALVAGLGFDASVWEIWPYLLSGACVHVPDDETRSSAAMLLDWIAASGLTICFAPTPLAEAMFEMRMPTLALRSLLVGGDKLHRVPAGLPFTVFNNYGPTESTVVASWTEVSGGSEAPPIGVPVDNTRLYVLDAHRQLVPAGVPGELYIAGDSLARGYLNRPGLTAERFVPDPFPIDPGGRMYRTGDLVRRLPGGALEFLGRLDDQVKVRGFRIELGEIEMALARHPAVREAVVVAREGRAGNRRLIAYVTPRGVSPDAAAVCRFLKDTLPDYMVPSAIVPVEAFPLTPNGKVDRQALPDPGEVRPAARESAPPSTPLERQLAAIWARVLRADRIGVDENFFEAGGDSILALQVVSAGRQAGIRITPRQVFEHPTVAELARVAGVPELEDEEDLAEGDVPLTPIQRWFFAEDVPRPEHFNQALMLVARRRVDAARIEQALRILTAHHDALRLRFARANGEWRQFYEPPGPADVAMERIDFAVRSGSREERMERESSRLQASFDLTSGPLVKAALFELGAGEPQRLLIVIHHLVIDTVSWRILLADLEEVYGRLEAGAAPLLPARTSSFKRWSEELAKFAASDEPLRELPYWTRATSGAGDVPVDVRGGANTAGSTDAVVLTLPADETRALLHDPARAYGFQPNDILITAVAQALAAWTGARVVTLCVESYGRDALADDLDLSRSVGWFTSMYPVAIDLSGPDDPIETLKRVKEQVRAVPRLGIGYGVLRYMRGGAFADALAAAAPAVSFNYLGQLTDREGDGGALFTFAPEGTGPVCDPWMPRAHALDISACIIAGVLRVTFTYSRTLHLRATVEALGRATLDAVGALVRRCRTEQATGFTASDFPEANITQGELERVLARIGQAGTLL